MTKLSKVEPTMTKMDADLVIIPEQLHARIPGGIGVYTKNVLRALIDESARLNLALRIYGSRRVARPDPFDNYGAPVTYSRLSNRLLLRSWDSSLIKIPKATRGTMSLSMAGPGANLDGRTAFTVYDLAFRKYPHTMTSRGVRWHEDRLRKIRESTAMVVTISEQTIAELIQEGFDSDRLCLAPPGSNHLGEPNNEMAQALLLKLNIRSHYLITVGTLEPRKNLDRLFEAFSIYRTETKSDVILLVVGPAGWGESVNPKEGIILAGRVDDAVLCGLLDNALALVYVPIYEGFGLPPLEAMSRSIPVVASPMPSTSFRTSIIVDPLSSTDIARGIAEVMDDSFERANLVLNGSVFASSTTWENAASKILDAMLLR